MRRMLLVMSVAALMAAMLVIMAVPALAINDSRVPAENCAPSNAQAVGHPAASTGLAQTEQVGPPASANNPGVSTGALGEAQSNAVGTCPGSVV